MQFNHQGEARPRHSLRSPLIAISPPTDARLDALNTLDSDLIQAPQEEDSLLHLLIGPLYAVNTCRHELHLRGYAEPNDWSIPLRLLHTAEILRGQHFNDVMRVLRKRIRRR